MIDDSIIFTIKRIDFKHPQRSQWTDTLTYFLMHHEGGPAGRGQGAQQIIDFLLYGMSSWPYG